MPKQWRIPLPDAVITAMLVFPIGFTLVILYYSSVQALVVSSVLLGLGFVVYVFCYTMFFLSLLVCDSVSVSLLSVY
jgi:hypothetical protein